MRGAFIAALAALLLAPAAAHAQASPSPYTSGIRYDAVGRVTGTISADPDGAGPLPFLAVRNTYDAAGRLLKVETGSLSAWQSEAIAPSAWPGFTVHRTLETNYDAMSRKTRERLREGAAGPVRAVTQYSYDAIGRLECTATRMNAAAFASLPASACTLGTEGSDGPDRITRNIYDGAGQRLQLREGVGTSVEAAEASWDYNLNGQVRTVIDGNGNRAELRYDGHGRQDRWTFPSAAGPAAYNDSTPATALATAGTVNAADYEQYGYDPNGNRISLKKRDNTTLTYQYDALNRATVKIVPERPAPHPYPLTPAQTRDVHYGYDLRGLQTFARFDSATGEGVTNAYDGFGRLLSSEIAMGGTTRLLGYRHDRNGNRTRITHPDGIYFTTDHDGLNRPVWLRQNGPAAPVYIGYNSAGLPVGMSRANGTASEWGYDGVQRLSGMLQHLAGTAHDSSWTFGHNPASQIGSVTRDNDAYAWTGHYAVDRPYTTDGLNRYTAAGSASFAYDLNGNLTADGANTYLYDVENRLVGRSGTVTLTYDPLGRLFSVASAITATQFLYDGSALVAEYAAGAMTRRYVHNVGADVPLLSYQGAGLSQISYLHADHQGSIVAISGAAGNGTINRYDEYGIPGAGNSGRFQYTGQIWIPELGLYHYKARIYSPTLGRFLQTDPVGYEDQVNLYAYVGNDPLNLTDPMGQRSCGRHCWETDAPAVKAPNVRADPRPLAYATRHSSEVEVRNHSEAVRLNENLSAIVPEGESFRIERLESEGGGREVGESARGEGRPIENMAMVIHGQAETIVPGPLDDDAIVNHGIANGVAHNGRFGVIEFVNGRFRFTMTRGRPLDPETRGARREADNIVDSLDVFQRRRQH